MSVQYFCPTCGKAVHDPDCPEATTQTGVEKLIEENERLRQQLHTLVQNALGKQKDCNEDVFDPNEGDR